MPIENGDYEPRSTQEVFESLAEYLLDEEPDANPQSESTYIYAILWAIAATIANEQEISLQNVYQAAYIQDASGEELTKKALNLGVVRQQSLKATGVVTFSRSSPATSDITIPAGTIVETLESGPVQFETQSQVTLQSGTSSVQATVIALEGGSEGNVGPNAIQSMPSPPAGIDTVTNTNATGDPSLTDTNGDPLQAGRNRESDTRLRERVSDTDASDEGPSPNGIGLALANTEGVISSHINTNQTDNTVNGLAPYETEVVVYGGDVYDIATTLTETMSVTTLLRLTGGVNGTQDSATVHINLLDQDVQIPITRPTRINFDVELDVVHDDTYSGTETVKDEIVQYVGGTYLDDSVSVGTDLGENVLVNEIENRAEDVTGVDYANVTVVDTNSDGADDTTTDGDGVPILAIANSEVARVDADAITVNETAR